MPKTKRVKKQPQYVTKPMLDRALTKALGKALAEQDARTDQKLAALEARFEARFVTNERFDAAMATISVAFTDQERRLSGELARHTKAIMEYVGTLIRAIDDEYKDLPGRVAALEAKVSG